MTAETSQPQNSDDHGGKGLQPEPAAPLVLDLSQYTHGGDSDSDPGPEREASPTSSRPTRYPNWRNFMLTPIVGLSYLAHIRYRRYAPRRLPTFTSMSVHEIYAYMGLSSTIAGISDELRDEVLDDPDLKLLEAVARSHKQYLSQNPASMRGLEYVLDSGVRENLRELRNSFYDQAPGILGKLAWWHNHVWSSEESWFKAAGVSLVVFGGNLVPPVDVDRWFTHLATTLQSGDDFLYADYGVKALAPLAATVPFAMAARWTKRPLLFRPVNGLQRALFLLSIYADVMQSHQHYANLRALKHKEIIAQRLRERFQMDVSVTRENP